MVAPSYQSFDILTEPYTLNNKTYIKVRNPKTGTERQVRFYEPSEYKKAFPNAQTPEEKITFAPSPKSDPYYKPQKIVLGFLPPEDSITIFRGDIDSDQHIEFFRSHGAKYTRWWGWYFPSSSLPTSLPPSLEPVTLPWASVAANEDSLLPDSALAPIIDSFLYPSSSTPPNVPIGTRIDLNITVRKALVIETSYGPKLFYVFHDTNTQAQEYVWTTSSCSWPEGSTHSIRGTVKDIQLYHGNYQIVLTRCTERK